ncbi:uncharacterized protein LOC144441598 [Glandiceps talaboti]
MRGKTVTVMFVPIILLSIASKSDEESYTECYHNADQSDYRGTVSVTETGKTCQYWTDQSPHEHDYTEQRFPNGGLGDHNYCRNPGKGQDNPTVWCYTIYQYKRWENCIIPNPDEECGLECSYSSECQNGGTCENGGTCTCISGYSGKQCSKHVIPDCSGDYDCNYYGYCIYGSCSCQYGHSGTYCQNSDSDSDDDSYTDDFSTDYIPVTVIVTIVTVILVSCLFFGICAYRAKKMRSMTSTLSTNTVITSGVRPDTSNTNSQQYQYVSGSESLQQHERSVPVAPSTSGSPTVIPMTGGVTPSAPPELSNDNPPAYDVVEPTNAQSDLLPPPSYEAALLISDSGATNDPPTPV